MEVEEVLIVKSLLTNPRVLILDNPFIGLDVSSRSVLNKLLIRLSELDNLQIVLVLSDPADIPDFITDVLPVKDKSFIPLSATEFLSSIDLQVIICFHPALCIVSYSRVRFVGTGP